MLAIIFCGVSRRAVCTLAADRMTYYSSGMTSLRCVARGCSEYAMWREFSSV